jgi:predicted RNase H-like HicB family nuclease
MRVCLERREVFIRFAILVDRTSTGFSAHVPGLPGCVAAGETKEETVQLLREAIEFHIERMRQHGESIPEPTSACEYVEVSASI